MSTSLSWLVGRSLPSVLRDDETDEWVFGFEGGYFLRVAAPWRVIKDERIAVGHRDHRQQFGLPQPVDAVKAEQETCGGVRSGWMVVHVRTGAIEGPIGPASISTRPDVAGIKVQAAHIAWKALPWR